ncbi:hypothetical protein BRADI_2g32969v3 [Brachypodium distachyon]|uniref:Uncharacterized protein n=1 Tax=Brachypodium distachyon TaxID=15368 RepID=A0A2K2DBI4_BRADI|nr:hypothetical protein BRADI_2g32969v3 [Brachypodium distachyon]
MLPCYVAAIRRIPPFASPCSIFPLEKRKGNTLRAAAREQIGNRAPKSPDLPVTKLMQRETTRRHIYQQPNKAQAWANS